MVEESQGQVPAPVDALWGLRSPSERGRKRSLSLDAVVHAAVALADTEGAGAVSMSRVATEVGFAPMALYRHVTNKHELLALMVEASIEPAAEATDPARSWRCALEDWARSLRSLIGRHPWLASINLTQLPFGPNRLLWLERGLQALADTTLSETEKGDVIMLLNNVVFSEARLTVDLAPSGAATPESFAALTQVFDPERFPALAQAFAGGMLATTGGQDFFEFGLARVLDGIAVLIDQNNQRP